MTVAVDLAHQRLTRVEKELRQERASALVRIANTLERLIARLLELHDAIGSTTSADEKLRLEDAYQQTRKDALLYRWYLEVQREAIGLTRHAVLDELYHVPGSLTRSTPPRPAR